MKNYGFRGFIIAFTFIFIVTFKSCSSTWQGTNGYITLTIISSIFGLIIGLVGLVIGKQFKTNKELSEIEFLKKYKKIILISTLTIIGIIFISNQLNSVTNFSNSISSTLKNNLENLNGKWEYNNKNQNEFWYLEISYDDATKTGSYVLSQQNESWGVNKNSEKKTIDTGKFNLLESYDRYGHKAYVGENPNTHSSVFLITEIDNKYAMDWMLRIRIIEEDMFGEKMYKTSN
jgi:hypothetical protein